MTYFISFFAHTDGGETRHGNTCLDTELPITNYSCITAIEEKIMEYGQEKYPGLSNVTVNNFQILPVKQPE